MSENHDKRDGKRWGAWAWLVLTLLVVLAYPLSYGPAVWVAAKIGTESFLVIYSPVVLFAENCPTWMQEALISYLDAWQ